MRVLFSKKVNSRHPLRHKNDLKNRFFGWFSSIPNWLSCEPEYLKKIRLDKIAGKKRKKNPKKGGFFQYFLRHFVNY